MLARKAVPYEFPEKKSTAPEYSTNTEELNARIDSFVEDFRNRNPKVDNPENGFY